MISNSKMNYSNNSGVRIFDKSVHYQIRIFGAGFKKLTADS
ncbi:hypothetical protein ACOWPH_29445 (plasmid) [Anabaena sp. PCC 7938]